MADSYEERESKFDVPVDFAVPDLAQIGAGARISHTMVNLVSTYYDTADLALFAHRLTLRRRTGDTDEGWQLKVPGKGVRTEIRVPLDGGDDVPAQLRDLLVGVSSGAPLAQIAQLRTQRRIHRVESGTDAVEVADDHVDASAPGEVEHVREWREVEAELVSGAPKLLRQVEKRLRAAGATPAASRSKLGRALGRTPAPIADASDLIRTYFDEQAAKLGAGDVDLRRGLDPIHRTRVATRRLRSVLRVLAPAFERDAAARLDAELSWYQNLLGEVRDREVQRKRFAAALESLPPELVLGPVAAELDASLASEQLAARERLVAALDESRYRELLVMVREFTREPPLANATTITDVVQLADGARRKANRRLRKGIRRDDASALHRARKAIKRARYATELVEPVAGRAATQLVKAHKRLQDELGEHQDSVVASELLRRFGASLGAGAKRNGFTYGLLWQREQDLARRARKRLYKSYAG